MPKTRRNPLPAATLALVACFASSLAVNAEVVRGVQYFHTEFEHYFMTGDQAEIARLDAGAFSGWFRTGTFYQLETDPKPGYVAVCRFFSPLGGKATHFFTAFADECELVKHNPDWTYEGVAFYTLLPDAQGACPEGTGAIHRLYNDGHGASPNHAYTPDVLKKSLLIVNGWISEGVAFCLPASTDASFAKMQLLANTQWVFPLSEPADCREDAPAYIRFSQPVAAEGRMSWIGAPNVDYASDISVGGDNDCRLGVSGADTGFTGWDAGANQYVLYYSSGYGLYTLVLFDHADLKTVPVCKVKLTVNIDTRYATYRNLHPFQPWLWSPCVPGTATRIEP